MIKMWKKQRIDKNKEIDIFGEKKKLIKIY